MRATEMEKLFATEIKTFVVKSLIDQNPGKQCPVCLSVDDA